MATNDDYDSPWKDVLEQYLPEFLAFFFPKAYTGIDWTRGYTFLDTELQQVVRDAELGRRLADKLVQVWRANGQETWVLVHIEVQRSEESDFARRMFVYYYRLFDRYDRQIVSLAVLGDERSAWRPDRFAQNLWGCSLAFGFPVVKLLDYAEQRAELATSLNPFAVVVEAHLAAQETRKDVVARRQAKLALTRGLYRRGYQRKDVLQLFLFIDWLLRLPQELEAAFWHELQASEEEQRMAYITSVEQIGIQKGLEQGRSEGLEQGLLAGLEQGRSEGLEQGLLAGLELVLRLKFGAEAVAALLPALQHADQAQLKALYPIVETATTPDDVRRALDTLL